MVESCGKTNSLKPARQVLTSMAVEHSEHLQPNGYQPQTLAGDSPFPLIGGRTVDTRHQVGVIGPS